MKARKTGHIVNVSTIISRRTIPLMGAYCATKFALNSLDEALRIELRPDGVGVSLVCPGVTDTDFSANSRRSGVDSPWNHASGMSAGAVGEAIARAVERKRRRVYLTASGRFLLFLNWLSPALVDEILYRFVFRKLSARR
jgi:short-subunit dehydrogenase